MFTDTDRRTLFAYTPKDTDPSAPSVDVAPEGVTRHRFHFAGDRERVPVTMWLPPGRGPHPAVIAQHGAASHRESVYLAKPAQRWAARGLAVVAIDAPRHGERRTGEPILDRASGTVDIEVFTEFVRDLRHLVDQLERIGSLNAGRLGYVGWSMGALMGVPFVAVEPRVRAAVFCIAGSLARFARRALPAPIAERAIGLGDPASYAPMIAPRPVLQINTTGDELFSMASIRALHDAFREPKRLLLHPGSHAVWPEAGDMYREMWRFLATHLGVPRPEARAS